MKKRYEQKMKSMPFIRLICEFFMNFFARRGEGRHRFLRHRGAPLEKLWTVCELYVNELLTPYEQSVIPIWTNCKIFMNEL